MTAANVDRILRNGVAMPAISLGCWCGWTDEEIQGGWTWILTALQAGYRQLDTAVQYATEPVVAKAVKESGMKREDLFITTKMNWSQSYDVQAAFNQSLKDLETEYVDLYLMHWPFTVAIDEHGADVLTPEGDLEVVDRPNFHDVWAGFEKIYESGRARAIGVSNFSIKTLNELLTTARIGPHVNQVEMHPYLAQNELFRYCKENDIMITAYTPTGE
ncbi:hypothetical protein EIP91_004907 [Steccherinum ochraceum]|uniref:NADP-dependent oxidoreductase domain-containing protein n=1 Tax=Steccherinum ochraceum TaxID=92696 RepID=A0A4R0R811_9APHY|nr:hypothetical protein EIP91_004907 [Steccherinum ochraceum]